MTTLVPFGGPPSVESSARVKLFENGSTRKLPMLASRETRNVVKRTLEMQTQLSNLADTRPAYRKVYEINFGRKPQKNRQDGLTNLVPMQDSQDKPVSLGFLSKPAIFSLKLSRNLSLDLDPPKHNYKRWSEPSEECDLAEESADYHQFVAELEDSKDIHESLESPTIPLPQLPPSAVSFRLGPSASPKKAVVFTDRDPSAAAVTVSDSSIVDNSASAADTIALNVHLIRVSDGGLIREITQIKERHNNLQELTKLKQKEAAIQRSFLDEHRNTASRKKPRTAPAQLQQPTNTFSHGKLSEPDGMLSQLLASESKRDLIQSKTMVRDRRDFRPDAIEKPLAGGIAWSNSSIFNIRRGPRTHYSMSNHDHMTRLCPTSSQPRRRTTIHPAADALKGTRLMMDPRPSRHQADASLKYIPSEVLQTGIPMEAAQRLYSINKGQGRPLRTTPAGK